MNEPIQLDLFTIESINFLDRLLRNIDNSLDKADMVVEFCNKTDASDDPNLWLTLIKEEAREVSEAAANLLKEITDLHYVYYGLTCHSSFDSRLADYHLIEALALGEKYSEIFNNDQLSKAFERVHKSNMSKLQPDGSVIKREDGKITKGPNYKPADLSDLIC